MEDILIIALQKYKEGKYQEALNLYQEILKQNPNHLQGLVNAGKLYLKAKKPNIALRFLERANKVNANNPEILNNIGKAYIQLDNLVNAKNFFSQSIILDEKYTPAMINLAKIYRKENKNKEAIEIYNKVLEIKPQSIIALNNLGNIYHGTGKVDKAEELYRKALKLNPENAQLHLNFGNILQLKNKYEEALKEYERAIILNPGLEKGYKNLMELYGRIYPYEKAMKAFEDLFKKTQKIPDILFGSAILAINNGDFKLAIRLLSKNHELFPEHYETLYQLGISYHQTGFFKKAQKAYNLAYKLNQDSDLLLYAMAKSYSDLKQDEKAIEFLSKAIRVNPDNFTVQHELIRHRLNVCDWSQRKDDERTLREISLKQIEQETNAPIPFLNLNYFKQDKEFLKRASEHTARNNLRKVERLKSEVKFKHRPVVKEKLRIGYISPDFRDHPTGRVTVDFIGEHNKDEYEVYCFSIIADLEKDPIQNKFREHCDHFISLYNVPLGQAAKKIYDLNIDILIDLSGYTTYTRTEILALQPAPVQCQMVGFPGTMGDSFIQYIFGDEQLIPHDHEPYYYEKVVRLPYGFPGSVLDVNKDKKKRSDFNLPENVFIYCCFNSQYKLSPEIFDIWVEVLKKVPESVLLLKGGSGIYKQNVINEIKKRSLDSSRIIFAENLPFPDYMARNSVCNLFLDTFYYTAGSTAVNALQAGLPVLTYTGNTNASRMGTSILNAAGLNDFICTSIEEYKERAIYYGKNPDKLELISQELESSILNSALFDSKQFARNLEKGFDKIWENYLSGSVAQSFHIK